MSKAGSDTTWAKSCASPAADTILNFGTLKVAFEAALGGYALKDCGTVLYFLHDAPDHARRESDWVSEIPSRKNGGTGNRENRRVSQRSERRK
jgi:hypothetical protein